MHNVLKLLLRIFELKIKFAFYDLPCSFPIKRIFRRFRFIYFFFLAEAPVSLCLSLSIAHYIHSIICLLSRTIFFIAHECSNSLLCHSKLIDQNFWAHHICNYEIKDKQTRSALHTHLHLLTMTIIQTIGLEGKANETTKTKLHLVLK